MLRTLQAAEGDRLVVAFHDDLPSSRGTRQLVNAALSDDQEVYLVGKVGRRVLPG